MRFKTVKLGVGLMLFGLSQILAQTNQNNGDFTDNRDNHTYKYVHIGTQVWMAENLTATKYTDGTAIPNVTIPNNWDTLTSGAVCTYNNTANLDTINTYGRLYNWYAGNSGKLCPTGWHLPSDSEWTILTNYLGDKNIVGGKLKETGTAHWHSPNEGSTNETSFTALPGGYREYNGSFLYIGNTGYWWSSTQTTTTKAYPRAFINYTRCLYILNSYKVMGFSVRCLRN